MPQLLPETLKWAENLVDLLFECDLTELEFPVRSKGGEAQH